MLGLATSFTSKNPGFGDLGFLRNIAGHLRTASMRATELGASMRSCGAQVAESWTGAAHDYWDAKLVEQASATEALAPQWAAVDTALTTYVVTVEQIFKSGEEYRSTIDSYLSTAASANISVRFMTVGLGEQHQVTLTAPLMAGATDEEFRAKQTQASDLQVVINAEVDKFWALQDDRDAANLALTSAISANLPAGWAELKGSFPAGTNPATMLPVVPAEFYGFDGIDAANKVAELVDVATGEVDPQAWVIIGEHLDDPMFREQFMSVLGPERAILLGLDVWKTGDTSDNAGNLESLRVLMMAGSPPAVYDGDWVLRAGKMLESLPALWPGPVPTFAPSAGAIISMVVGDGLPVLLGGTCVAGGPVFAGGMVQVSWAPSSLAILADTLLIGDGDYVPFMTDHQGWNAIDPSAITTYGTMLAALGNNPDAAVSAFAGHCEEYLALSKLGPTLIGRPPVGGPTPVSVDYEGAYAEFLKAATVTGQGVLADGNASFVINKVGESGSDQGYPDATRGVFGDIAGKYWGDFEYSVNARWNLIDNPYRPGVECDLVPWKNFLLEGMRSPIVGATVLGMFQDALSLRKEPKIGTWYDELGKNPVGSDNGTYLLGTQGGILDLMCKHLFTTLIDERQGYENQMNDTISEFVDFAGSIAGGGRVLSIDLIKDFVKDFVEYKDENLVFYRSLMTSIGDGQTVWENLARGAYKNGAIIDVYTIVDGKMTKSFASPLHYEKLATDAAQKGDLGVVIKFTNSDGTLMDSETLRQGDPRAYQAYLEWLASPAVQTIVGATGDPYIVRDPSRGVN